jgi:hypothetical protein
MNPPSDEAAAEKYSNKTYERFLGNYESKAWRENVNAFVSGASHARADLAPEIKDLKEALRKIADSSGWAPDEVPSECLIAREVLAKYGADA